ncbi:MAG: hypothetical protein DWI58_16815, partial [Chloroflexi bacterium]
MICVGGGAPRGSSSFEPRASPPAGGLILQGLGFTMYVVQTTDLTKIYNNRYIALNALDLRVEK